jgi:hypothetical protein
MYINVIGSYSIEQDELNTFHIVGDVSYKTISFVSTNYANIKYPYLEQQAFLIKKRKNNNDIVLLYINNISNEK